MRKLVKFIKQEDGTLRIELIESEREEVQEIYDHEDTSERKFIEVLEYQLCNGWDLIRAEDIGALTDSILISDEAVFDDDDNLIDIGAVYYDNFYAIRDPLEYLLRDGYVEFWRA